MSQHDYHLESFDGGQGKLGKGGGWMKVVVQGEQQWRIMAETPGWSADHLREMTQRKKWMGLLECA